MAKLKFVPCIIKVGGAVDALAIMVAENSHREEVNPVEEGRFYQRVLVEMCGNDVDVLCQKVRRNRDFVEGRLLLLSGYPSVVDALQENQISLAVARELNKVRQPNQLMLLLDTAIRQGATARTVAEWRKQLNADEDLQVLSTAAAADAGNGAVSMPAFQQLCFFCADGDDPHLMVTVHMHKPCLKNVRRALGHDVDGNAAQVN
jgi:ParB family chromosome partitioning protein